MCNGGNVLDRTDLEACSLQGADCGFATGTGALDEHVNLADAVLLGAVCSSLSSQLCGVGGGLTGALEAHVASGGPGDHCTGGIGDGDDGVVEGRLDVSLTSNDVLANLAAVGLVLRAAAARVLGGIFDSPTKVF